MEKLLICIFWYCVLPMGYLGNSLVVLVFSMGKRVHQTKESLAKLLQTLALFDILCLMSMTMWIAVEIG